MKKLLIFDFDGTLADSLLGIHTAINHMECEMGYPEHRLEAVRRAIGNGARTLVRRLIPAEAAENPQAFAAAFASYEKAYDKNAENTALFEGIPEMLGTLKKRGYMLAILSNKQERHLRGLVKEMFEPGIISFALGQTDGFPLKPDPTAVRHIMQEFGFSEEETALIGDSPVDVKTAKNAGIMSVAVTWGYTAREMLADEGADALAGAPEEITEIFGHKSALDTRDKV